jgi:predicted GIY-YIG superfamily endonuclease
MNTYWVYILASEPRGTLYLGVTNNILGRVELHRAGKGSVFTSRYRVSMLVYFEEFQRCRRGHSARENAEALCSGLEDQLDRARKSALG